MKIVTLRGPRDLFLDEQDIETNNLRLAEIWIETAISALKFGPDRGNYEGAEYTSSVVMYPRSVGDNNLGILLKI